MGAVVLFVAAFFLIFSYNTANVKDVSGYEITADFSSIGGLSVGDDVQISGVKVGTITGLTLNTETYLAEVRMSIDPSIKIPEDTAAIISSESLLGGRFMGLEPGAMDTYIPSGGKIQYTQAAQNLEQLLGEFIFNAGDAGAGKEDSIQSDGF